MSNRERKIEAREKRKAERKERHKEIKNTKKADKTAEEYSLAGQQTGRVGASFSLIHRHQDARHAQQLLLNQAVVAADDPIFDTYYSINTPGTFFVWDKEAGKVVFGVRCTPVTHLTEVEKFDEFFKHIHQDSHLHSPVKTNGALVTGAMWAMGWRAGYERGIAFDTYSYPKNGKKTEEWDNLRSKDYGIHSFYGYRFSSMASAFFSTTQQLTQAVAVPLWGQRHIPEKDLDMQDFCFASNLTYTKSDSHGRMFSNKPHKDNDGSPMTFGVWGLVDENGALSKGKVDMMKGVFFYIASYRIKVDFAARTDCVWELVWRGKEDVHATVEGTVVEGYNWVGSSAQTSRSLIQRVNTWTKAQV